MKSPILKIKYYTKYNNELFKPMAKVRPKLLAGEDLAQSIKVVENVAEELSKIMGGINALMSTDKDYESWVNNCEGMESPVRVFPEQLPLSCALDLNHKAYINYFNYIASRGNWIMQWLLVAARRNGWTDMVG